MEEVLATGTERKTEEPGRPSSETDLKFKQERMVRWLEPKVLGGAALRVVLSSVFGSYADKRETQGAAKQEAFDYAGEDEPFWLDFVADVGDGFDSTYAVASLLGRRELTLAKRGEDGKPEGAGTQTRRGRVLVMGGDEVYPTPSRDAYENRFRGPYEAALPWVPLDEPEPHLFAIPGNHDWYDGLTSFLRLFCSERWIGAWSTRQRRSYFALKLPHNWWLLAVDIQLDTYIDDPQLAYFKALAANFEPGSKVILVTGKPSWVKVEDDTPFANQPESYKNLAYFKKEVLAQANVPVTISGDLHHYVRYRADDGSHLITAGGGGAYLYPTHMERETLNVPGDDDIAVAYKCDQSLFPSRKQSKRLKWGALALAWHAPGLMTVFAVVYALLGASVFGIYDSRPGWWVGFVMVTLLLWGGLSAYADPKRKRLKALFGFAHAALHVAAATFPAWIVAEWMGESGVGWGAVTAAASGVGAYPAAGLIFGAYLIVTHRWTHNQVNEVLACQGIPDYKNFLRMRFDSERLTIYPVGIRKVPRSWEADPDPDPGNRSAPWLKPKSGRLEDEVLLIEDPIEIASPQPPDSPE